MYTDTLFNFWQITENEGIEEGTEILSEMAKSKPSFALDAGIRADDIYARVDRIRDCISAIENDENRRCIEKIIHFAAGIMGDSDSVENRFDYVENLENTINDFKSSDDEYASRLVAIGPCGIDHDWDSVEYEGRDHEYFDSHMVAGERDLFALQLTLAKKLNMPLILHSRKGFKDTADVLKAVKWNKGVVHGYSYSKSDLDFFLDLGWYISFSGSVTYSGKKAALDMAETVSYVPKDRILIETDSPYYAPVPLKNTYNNPNNINYIYEYIAAKRGITASKLSSIVDSNCEKLFSL
ncbi:MAG: TatD family hydrolase [Treponema sp.]|nr:TatD family hydrolase [Treponema sp.]